jgi:hypothetical protein
MIPQKRPNDDIKAELARSVNKTVREARVDKPAGHKIDGCPKYGLLHGRNKIAVQHRDVQPPQ